MRCMLQSIAALSLLFCSQGKVVADAVLSPGDILTANFGGNSITQVNPMTGAQAVVSSGGNFSAPLGIAIDSSGSIIVTDVIHDEIIRVDPATGAQTIISSDNNLIFPAGITIAAAGDLLVADRTAHEVIRIDPITGAQAVAVPPVEPD